jgi:hypothetical protein
MKRHGSQRAQHAHDDKAEAAGEQAAGGGAILHTVAIVSEKRFRLDIELRHPR